MDSREKQLKMIEEWMTWSKEMGAEESLETLLFITVVESKNRNVTAGAYMRRLVEKWSEVDSALGFGKELAEA